MGLNASRILREMALLGTPIEFAGIVAFFNTAKGQLPERSILTMYGIVLMVVVTFALLFGAISLTARDILTRPF